MNCPICSEAMSPGKVFLEKSWASFLIFGFGSRDLFFRSDDDGRKQQQMNAWDTNEALKCAACGALLIAGSSRD